MDIDDSGRILSPVLYGGDGKKRPTPTPYNDYTAGEWERNRLKEMFLDLLKEDDEFRDQIGWIIALDGKPENEPNKKS